MKKGGGKREDEKGGGKRETKEGGGKTKEERRLGDGGCRGIREKLVGRCMIRKKKGKGRREDEEKGRKRKGGAK